MDYASKALNDFVQRVVQEYDTDEWSIFIVMEGYYRTIPQYREHSTEVTGEMVSTCEMWMEPENRFEEITPEHVVRYIPARVFFSSLKPRGK